MKSQVLFQIPKGLGPFQVDKAAHGESSLRQEEGSVPRNQTVTQPSEMSRQYICTDNFIIISITGIRNQNNTTSRER